jgi:hypothetical protein
MTSADWFDNAEARTRKGHGVAREAVRVFGVDLRGLLDELNDALAA